MGWKYPAHLHIDLLPEYQSGGYGTKMMQMLLEDLRDICHKNLSEKSIHAINVVHKYSEILKTNVNLNLAMENFAVEICK